MIRYNQISSYPPALPLASEDILEYHAARLLLLIRICGAPKSGLEGITKMAKLDFFVRYPQFFHRVVPETKNVAASTSESRMIRYHYGPWDPRYYQILAFLRATELIDVRHSERTFWIKVTEEGQKIAGRLMKMKTNAPLVKQIKEVKKALGAQTGTALKDMIYRHFAREVADVRKGAPI